MSDEFPRPPMSEQDQLAASDQGALSYWHIGVAGFGVLVGCTRILQLAAATPDRELFQRHAGEVLIIVATNMVIGWFLWSLGGLDKVHPSKPDVTHNP